GAGAELAEAPPWLAALPDWEPSDGLAEARLQEPPREEGPPGQRELPVAVPRGTPPAGPAQGWQEELALVDSSGEWLREMQETFWEIFGAQNTTAAEEAQLLHSAEVLWGDCVSHGQRGRYLQLVDQGFQAARR
ncbi:unnamed protein product, partial [Prorocentrum cordatum]